MPADARAGSTLRALLRASRPRQWSKNVLLLAAPCAAGAMAQGQVAGRVAAAFVAFCMLASATYLLNDVRDAEQDRLHPRKRLRPVAAGELSERAALVSGGLLACGGLGLALLVAPLLGALGVVYLLLTVSYSLWLRGVVLLDIGAVAGGFVVRAAAGGAAAPTYPPRSFLFFTAFGATFLVVGKRYAELLDASPGGPTRRTLRSYSPGALRALLVAAGVLTVVAYALWAVTGPGGGPWHALSVVPLVLWLGRYAALVARGAGQSPEEVIAGDRALLLLTAVWAALFLGGVYAGR